MEKEYLFGECLKATRPWGIGEGGGTGEVKYWQQELRLLMPNLETTSNPSLLSWLESIDGIHKDLGGSLWQYYSKGVGESPFFMTEEIKSRPVFFIEASIFMENQALWQKAKSSWE